jgi:hypothetical protein
MIMITIPSADPMPLPGPLWLLKTLLLVVFFLHLLAMNCALAGGLTVLFNAVRGRSERHPFSRRLAQELAPMLPVFVSFTVTLGVAALLFVQVIYGNLLYTSSILLGAAWLGVVPLVIIGYYGYYYFSNKLKQSYKASALTMGVASLCFLGVAFVLVNNMSLMLTPEKWSTMYRAHTNGFQLNWSEPTLLARYLHMLVGAFTVFTAVLAHLGVKKTKSAVDAEYGAWLVRRSSIVFALTTGVQFITGTWFLMTMPKAVAVTLFRDPVAGSVFGVSVILALVSMMLLLMGGTAPKPGALVHAGFGCTLLTLGLMVGLRQMVRTAYLAPHFDPTTLAVSSQTGVIVLFLVTFVAGLATVGWMVVKVAKAGKVEVRGVGAD